MMNHTITIGGLLLALGLLAGVAIVGFGLLAYFAAGMSDNGEASADAERSGCKFLIIGAALAAASIYGLVA